MRDLASTSAFRFASGEFTGGCKGLGYEEAEDRDTQQEDAAHHCRILTFSKKTMIAPTDTSRQHTRS